MERELGALHSGIGLPSIEPQMLLRASYSVGSERQLIERMEFDLLSRRFVGLGADEAVWDASIFSKNRDRLLEGDIAARFLAILLAIRHGAETRRGYFEKTKNRGQGHFNNAGP